MYIAAHGSSRSVGNVDLLEALVSINVLSRDYNITGVLLGSCYAGKASTTIEACIEESAIRWCVGYASSASWMEGTLIDCSILSVMSELTAEDHCDAAILTNALADAVAPFAATYPIGDDRKNRPVALKASLQAVIQPAGQGHRARNVSDQVFQAHARRQLP
ncbi:hypothetical protein ACI48D_25645 [Massilia sp. LXY-6]|uniref:hypothetical protein n=1 Tax=Massilia sp. LXY-6 TaxID=3379823 RepID=UPI003EDF03FC